MILENPIAKGNTAAIYLVDNKIVKVFNDNLPKSTALYEADKQKLAYSYGLSVPKIIDIINVNNRQAIVMEHIQGETLGNMLLNDIENSKKYMQISIDIQRKIHAIEVKEHELMYDRLIMKIKEAKLLNTKQKDYLLKKINNMTYDTKLCHGDFHFFNIIMQNENPVIIDWVDSSIGNITADVYRSYLLYSQFSLELADLYLNLYCQNSGICKDEIFVWAPILAGARLSENVSTENEDRLLKIVNEGLKKGDL